MTSRADIDRLFDAQQRRRRARAIPTADERVAAIRRLEKAVLAARADIRAAMWEDFRKPPQEVDLTEVYAIVSETRHARRNLRGWMKPQRVRTPLALIGSRSHIHHEPKGVVLVISPWNFPFNLSFGPIVSAIAAGNSVILKPSELTPASSACIGRIVSSVFDEDEVAVIEGDATTGAALLEKPFDHIFFTGSTAVGRLVMTAAARHLTSVTLELGGKSPVVVEKSADVEAAARRTAWGKFVNAGQICIAPDYVLVDESIHAPFVEALRHAIAAMPDQSKSLLVNDAHATRVRRLIGEAVADGGEVVTGGPFEGRLAPATVITRVPPSSAAMQEEIFGPLLPVLPYAKLDDALATVASLGKPLALYVFSRDRAAIDDIVARTSAGGTAINHTLIHFFQPRLPFGGSGASGMGRGHGRFGFEAFSNARGVLEQRTRISPIEWLFPPYNRIKNRLIDGLIRYL